MMDLRSLESAEKRVALGRSLRELEPGEQVLIVDSADPVPLIQLVLNEDIGEGSFKLFRDPNGIVVKRRPTEGCCGGCCGA